MSPEKAREIVKKVRNGERIQVEVRADLHPEIAEKEAERMERQLERVI
jgi:Mn-dependent DtxR family transcriptional regulator